MADAPLDNQLLRSQRPLEPKAPEKISGIVMAPSQDLKVHADAGGNDLVFVAFVLEKDNTSGAITEKNAGCNTAAVSWTNLYSTPAGKSAYVSLTVLNKGTSAGQYSAGLTVTTVVGEEPPA